MTRARPALEIAAVCGFVLAAGLFVIAVRARSNWDQDIWWHLATGRWMVEHRSLPPTDPFSQFGEDKPLIAYSWLFELIAYGAHQSAGLKGIVLLTAVLSMTIAGALYVLFRANGAAVERALILSAGAFYALMPLVSPRPWMFSTLFLLIELIVIATATRDAARRLWLLPPLFVAWTNVHIQFVVGLAVLGAAAADAFWYQTDPRRATDAKGETVVPVGSWVRIGVACVAATLLNPYTFRIHLVAREYAGQTAWWSYIGEFLAPAFRTSPDWVMLAIVLTAAGCIGWQARNRPVRVFWLLLFVFGIWLGFRSRRDTWFMVATAGAIIAGARFRAAAPPERPASPRIWPATIAVGAVAALVAIVTLARLSEERLEANVARTFPVAAAAFVEQRGVAAPIYNHYDWGGYLLWRLPGVRVAMDGRAWIYGQERVIRHVDTWEGRRGWRTDPDLLAARVVIAPRDRPLSSLLRLDERFTLVYEDPAGPAVVFEAR